MVTDRQMIEYLPPYLQGYTELQALMHSEQSVIDELWGDCLSAFADQFLSSATEYGVSRWERMLAISPKDTDTLAERKYRILSLLNQDLPYTMRGLERALTTLCGADGFSIDLQANEYYIEIKLALANKSMYADVESVLRKMIPANMVTYVQIMYNSHNVLAGYTHAYLAQYSHHDIRNEVLK